MAVIGWILTFMAHMIPTAIGESLYSTLSDTDFQDILLCLGLRTGEGKQDGDTSSRSFSTSSQDDMGVCMHTPSQRTAL